MWRVEEAYNAGKKYIIPQRDTEWKEFCEESIGNIMSARLLRDAIEVMKLLHEGELSFAEIEEKVEGGSYSGMAWSCLENAVALFAPRGYDFAMDRTGKYMSKERRQSLEKANEENKAFLHNNNPKR